MDNQAWWKKHKIDSRVCSAFNNCVTITNSFKNKISFKVLDYSDSLEIDSNISNISNIENINKEDLRNKKIG